MSSHEFFLSVVNIQKSVAGVEITGATKEERIEKMKKLFLNKK